MFRPTGRQSRDIAGHANGSFQLTRASRASGAGGGSDFTGLHRRCLRHRYPGFRQLPASTATVAIINIFSRLYVKLPSLSDWNQTATIAPFIQFNANVNGYTQDQTYYGLSGFFQPKSYFNFRRQTNGSSTVDQLSPTVPAGDHSQVAQIAFLARRHRTARPTEDGTEHTTPTTAGAVGEATIAATSRAALVMSVSEPGSGRSRTMPTPTTGAFTAAGLRTVADGGIPSRCRCRLVEWWRAMRS